MNKRRFIFGMILWLCMLIVANPATAFGQNYEVAVNQSQVLNIEGVKRVAIANPSIADVLVVSDSELLLVGKAPGVTSMQVWTDRVPSVYSVHVSGPEFYIGKQVKIEAKIVEIDRGKIKNLAVWIHYCYHIIPVQWYRLSLLLLLLFDKYCRYIRTACRESITT